MINSYRFGVGGGSYDLDAQKFITANGALTVPQEVILNQLVLDLKYYGLWNKGYAYYPYIGGTASAHKWNLFNPIDTDGAFRGIFSGGITHNANGIQGNGTNGAMDTRLIPSGVLTNNSSTLVFVSGTSGAYNDAAIGVGKSSSTFQMVIHPRYTGNNGCYMDQYSHTNGRIGPITNLDGSGVFINTRTSSSSLKAFINGTQIGTTLAGASSGSTTDFNKSSIGVLALNAVLTTGTPRYFAYSPRLCQGAGVFDGLTDTNVADLTTAINDFNTSLGR